MTRQKIVDEVLATRPGTFETRAAAEEAVDAIFGAVTAIVGRRDTVQIRGFGTFKMKHRKGRVGRNPQTGAEISIPARDAMVFSLPRRAD